MGDPTRSKVQEKSTSRRAGDNKNLSKINFSSPNAGNFAALDFPVGGATGVLYARRSADGIFTGDGTESGLPQFANLCADRF